MIKQVISVSAAASTIVTPSDKTKLCIIQNNGAGNVRLTFDGGASFVSPYGDNARRNDPTASTGYKLAAGQQVNVNSLAGGGGLHYPIRAILENATTTTLDIVTDDGNAV